MRTIVPSRFRVLGAPESDVRPGAIPTKPRACRSPMPPRDLTLNLPSKFDTRLGLHAVPKRMFHQGHLSHKIGHINERSEEHTSELQSLMRISYAVFCLKKKNTTSNN